MKDKESRLRVACYGGGVVDDARLNEAFRRRGVAFELKLLASRQEFLAFLDAPPLDCDAVVAYQGPGGLRMSEAQRLAGKIAPSHPFFLLVDNLESSLTAVIDAGVQDLVPLSSLKRLPYIVVRAVRQQREQEIFRANVIESKLRFSEIASHIDEVLWLCSSDGQEMLYLSPAFERIWGVPVGTIYAHPEKWLDFINKEDRKEYTELFVSHALAGREFSLRYRIQRPDGGTRWIEDRGFPIRNKAGELIRIAGLVRDMTEEVRLQDELRLAQRLEAVGQLAAGIAHEINTPAQFVGDNLTFLRDSTGGLLRLISEQRAALRRLEDSGKFDEPELFDGISRIEEEIDLDFVLDEFPSAIEQSIEGVERIVTIVRAMKDFSHPGSESQERTDINRLIENTVTVSRNEWKYVAELVTNLEQTLPAVQCFPRLLSQVLLNLIVNAAHAIERNVDEGNKGCITITTRQCNEEEIEIVVGDNGCGIPAEVAERVFDQFFTTKEVGKGTGQGLAMARNMISDAHAGLITFESRPGQGTDFLIRLPVAGNPKLNGVDASQAA